MNFVPLNLYTQHTSHTNISASRGLTIYSTAQSQYITGMEIFHGLIFLECHMYNIFLRLQLNQNLEQVYIEAATSVTKADTDSHVSHKSQWLVVLKESWLQTKHMISLIIELVWSFVRAEASAISANSKSVCDIKGAQGFGWVWRGGFVGLMP